MWSNSAGETTVADKEFYTPEEYNALQQLYWEDLAKRSELEAERDVLLADRERLSDEMSKLMLRIEDGEKAMGDLKYELSRLRGFRDAIFTVFGKG